MCTTHIDVCGICGLEVEVTEPRDYGRTRHLLKIMEKVTVKVLNESANELPEYATVGASGLDLRAKLDHDYELAPGARFLFKTGLFLNIPEGYEVQIRSRSGLAFKHGVMVLNSPGTIDSDYRGEIGALLINHGSISFVVKNGDRIAQAVLCKVERLQWESVDFLDTTGRNDGGFGSTGVQ
jgi:dUTP pyrophosphatase